MRTAQFLGLALTIGTMVATTSGCFATRVVRMDTTTSYAIVEAPPAEARVLAAPPAGAGTLVVEALVVPPPPASAARPVRLPDAVAALSATVLPAAPAAPGWDPLPSYVAQFTGPGWQHRAIFGGGSQVSTSFRSWGRYGARSAMTFPSGHSVSPGAYGSASPHFSSPPSYSGSLSSHFSGGYPGSGY